MESVSSDQDSPYKHTLKETFLVQYCEVTVDILQEQFTCEASVQRSSRVPSGCAGISLENGPGSPFPSSEGWIIAKSRVLSTSQHMCFLSKTSRMQRGAVLRLQGLQPCMFPRTGSLQTVCSSNATGRGSSAHALCPQTSIMSPTSMFWGKRKHMHFHVKQTAAMTQSKIKLHMELVGNFPLI